MITIGKMTVDYKTRPMGIDNSHPGFSWQLQSKRRSDVQTAYRILVSDNLNMLDRDQGLVWDSGIVRSSQSQHVIYNGNVLESGKRYYWKVKVWDRDGSESQWSHAEFWEKSISETDWKAQWITSSFLREPIPETDLLKGRNVIWDSKREGDVVADSGKRYFRLAYDLTGKSLSEAKLQIFATDALKVYVNGHFEGLYYPYLQTVTLDVLEPMLPNRNVIACCSDAGKPGFIAVLSLRYTDGSSEYYTTDAEWKVCNEQEDGWNLVNHYDQHWKQAESIGIFGSGDWSVYKFIPYPVNKALGPCPVFHKQFYINRPIETARLFITALGLYDCTLNGQSVSEDVFTPGWTDYNKRIPYQTYDISTLLQQGVNRIESIVGPGWYIGNLAIGGPYQYGKRVALRAQINIIYTDGTSEVIGSDEDWLTAESPVLQADIYMGETFDARRKVKLADWEPAVRLNEVPAGQMQAQLGPPIQRMQELAPQSIRSLGNGAFLIDMGQNMVGWLRLKVRGIAGNRITMRYVEQLNAEGRIYQDNLRTAKQTDTYILNGEGEETYEPRFTFHGFRYVEVTGYRGELTMSDVCGVVVHSAAEEVSEITTSHPLVNRLLENVKWSQRGNFFGIAMDCPQRDERLGWTGDAHAFARTATFNMDSADFYMKWLVDIRDGQGEDGAFPDVAPFVEHFGRGHVFFADGGVILPWILHRVYGDPRFIEQNYDAMKRWIDWMIQDSDEQLIRNGVSFGDHLSFGEDTSPAFMNAAFFAYSVKLMRKMAEIIGQLNDVKRYAELFERLKVSFQQRFVIADGKTVCDSQTSYVLALMIGFMPDHLEDQAFHRLVQKIHSNRFHLTTGFMGVSYVLPLLSQYGRSDIAGRLLLQEQFPSWLYQVKNGATTIWERWDGWSSEHGFQDPEMNSFNHYALGSVAEWVYRYLAGVDLHDDYAGYQKFKIQPQPCEGIDAVYFRYESLYGPIVSDWHSSAGQFILSVEVPVNCHAEIRVPASISETIKMDGTTISLEATKTNDLGFLHRDEQAYYFQVGSGSYNFEVSSGQ